MFAHIRALIRVALIVIVAYVTLVNGESGQIRPPLPRLASPADGEVPSVISQSESGPRTKSESESESDSTSDSEPDPHELYSFVGPDVVEHIPVDMSGEGEDEGKATGPHVRFKKGKGEIPHALNGTSCCVQTLEEQTNAALSGKSYTSIMRMLRAFVGGDEDRVRLMKLLILSGCSGRRALSTSLYVSLGNEKVKCMVFGLPVDSVPEGNAATRDTLETIIVRMKRGACNVTANMFQNALFLHSLPAYGVTRMWGESGAYMPKPAWMDIGASVLLLDVDQGQRVNIGVVLQCRNGRQSRVDLLRQRTVRELRAAVKYMSGPMKERGVNDGVDKGEENREEMEEESSREKIRAIASTALIMTAEFAFDREQFGTVLP